MMTLNMQMVAFGTYNGILAGHLSDDKKTFYSHDDGCEYDIYRDEYERVPSEWVIPTADYDGITYCYWGRLKTQ